MIYFVWVFFNTVTNHASYYSKLSVSTSVWCSVPPRIYIYTHYNKDINIYLKMNLWFQHGKVP